MDNRRGEPRRRWRGKRWTDRYWLSKFIGAIMQQIFAILPVQVRQSQNLLACRRIFAYLTAASGFVAPVARIPSSNVRWLLPCSRDTITYVKYIKFSNVRAAIDISCAGGRSSHADPCVSFVTRGENSLVLLRRFQPPARKLNCSTVYIFSRAGLSSQTVDRFDVYIGTLYVSPVHSVSSTFSPSLVPKKRHHRQSVRRVRCNFRWELSCGKTKVPRVHPSG